MKPHWLVTTHKFSFLKLILLVKIDKLVVTQSLMVNKLLLGSNIPTTNHSATLFVSFYVNFRKITFVYEQS